MNTKLSQIDMLNLVQALKQGKITWFQYFELIREVPKEMRIG